MGSYVLGFDELDRSKLSVVGGKGANLGELARLDGIDVPEGFCLSTAAFQRILSETPALGELLAKLATLGLEAREQIGELCQQLRGVIEAVAMPDEIAQDVIQALAMMGEQDAYAVRSSATAEDLPSASFAGQQDSYLNLRGRAAILAHISKCWASLFTERAALYRIQNGFDHRQVQLAVVVQKMVFSQASGILFTADPLSSNRKVLSIDASFGLGEALVSGLVSADSYKVRDGAIVAKTIATKKRAIYGRPAGGTETVSLAPEQQDAQTLTDAQILQLARLGRQIEAAFGCPQDIEWCLADGAFYIVQSRPITTLYPIPAAPDQENRVYVSVAHQQMMTDPMKPLGLDLFLLSASPDMRPAGGRLFVDCTANLLSPARRKILFKYMGQGDPLMKDALETIVERGDFLKTLPESPPVQSPAQSPTQNPAQSPNQGASHIEKVEQSNLLGQIEHEPNLVAELIQASQDSLKELKQRIQTHSGLAVVDFIVEDIQEMKKNLHNPQSLAVIMAAMNASAWVNEKINEWLGEKNVADALTLSVADNITAEMGMALLDVADAIRPYADVVAYLQAAQAAQDDGFLAGMSELRGGRAAWNAIQAYLERYGMRGAGEIDISNPRWSEKPTLLLPTLLSHIQNFEAGASQRKFAQLREFALNKEADILARLQSLPDGESKVAETQQKIGLIRKFTGYREYPKYAKISRSFVYKQALMQVAESLVRADILAEKTDVFYLTLEELRDVLRHQALAEGLIPQRKAEYRIYEKLSPPRVMTSDGETFDGRYLGAQVPDGALTGVPVSAGIIEGRARIVLKLEDAELAEGDILVTPFTDPGWTPLFLSVKGLITEVGGVMTHGAVIAREYGLPAVVSVKDATRLIQDGQRIRVNGTDGYVELLSAPVAS